VYNYTVAGSADLVGLPGLVGTPYVGIGTHETRQYEYIENGVSRARFLDIADLSIQLGGAFGRRFTDYSLGNVYGGVLVPRRLVSWDIAALTEYLAKQAGVALT
jgi:hypothetical protein